MDVKEIRRRNLAALMDRYETQERFAEAVSTNPGYLSQIVSPNNSRTMGGVLARKIEKKLGLAHGWMDTLMHDGPGLGKNPDQSTEGEWGHVLTWDEPGELPPGDYVFAPRSEVYVSAGTGAVVWDELEREKPQAFRADWAYKRSLKPENLRAIYASGDSMEPTISDGASLLVDISDHGVQDGKVYVIRFGDECRIKRLYKRPNGLLVWSDNDSHYPAISLDGSEAEGVEILGRVVWVSRDL